MTPDWDLVGGLFSGVGLLLTGVVVAGAYLVVSWLRRRS